MYIQYVNSYAYICYTYIWGALCTYNMLTPMLIYVTHIYGVHYVHTIC